MNEALRAMKPSYGFQAKNRPNTDAKGLMKDFMRLQQDMNMLLGKTTSKLQQPAMMPTELGAVVKASSLPAGTIPPNTPMLNGAGMPTMNAPMPEMIEEQVVSKKEQSDYKKILNPSNSFKVNTYKKEVKPKKASAGGLPFVAHQYAHRRLN
jgi:hypothetical protein